MKNIIRYILFGVVLCLAGQLRGESRVLRSLMASDGLTDLTVNALYKDSLGFVWIGTGNSVERFDGVFLKHYALSGADERLKRVNVITATAGHYLWMGNGQGLWRLNRQSDAFERVVPDVINGAVLMPTYGQAANDELARRALLKAFPQHEIVGIDCRPLIRQHGSLHCLTMQFPKGCMR